MRLPQDAANGEVDYYVTENESSSVNESERSSERMNDNDVNENEVRPRTASNRDASSPPSESPSGTENENDVTNDLENDEIASKGGVDITVPGISVNERNEENPSPRGGKYNLRPTLTPTLLMNTDTSQICKLKSRKSLELKWTPIPLGLLRL